MVDADVLAFAPVPAVRWGFSPVLEKRGMAAGGTALQAPLVVVTVDAVVYWPALAVSGRGATFAAALLGDLERVTREIVIGAGPVVVGAALVALG